MKLLTIDLVVNINQYDIDWSERGSCDKCPIAQALLRALNPIGDIGSVDHVEVADAANEFDVVVVCSTPSADKWRGKLPDEALDFISAYDRGGGDWLDPFSFPLKLSRI